MRTCVFDIHIRLRILCDYEWGKWLWPLRANQPLCLIFTVFRNIKKSDEMSSAFVREHVMVAAANRWHVFLVLWSCESSEMKICFYSAGGESNPQLTKRRAVDWQSTTTMAGVAVKADQWTLCACPHQSILAETGTVAHSSAFKTPWTGCSLLSSRLCVTQ